MRLENFQEANAASALFDLGSGEEYEFAEAPIEAAPSASEVAARIKRVIDAKAERGLPKRSKLSQKSAPQPTNYTDNALLPKVEVKRLRLIEAEAKGKKQNIARTAIAKAKAAFIQQPELAYEEHEAGAIVQDSEAPHLPHDMRDIDCAEATVIFCDCCGKWSRRNAHSKLSEPCSGVCGWRGGLTLLRNGIMPVQGAKLPPGTRRK